MKYLILLFVLLAPTVTQAQEVRRHSITCSNADPAYGNKRIMLAANTSSGGTAVHWLTSDPNNATTTKVNWWSTVGSVTVYAHRQEDLQFTHMYIVFTKDYLWFYDFVDDDDKGNFACVRTKGN